MKTILGQETTFLSGIKGDPSAALLGLEADVIVTSVVVGFCFARAIQGHPFSFDYDPTESEEEVAKSKRIHASVVEKIRRVLNTNPSNEISDDEWEARLKGSVAAGPARVYGLGHDEALITGRAGGQALEPPVEIRGDLTLHRDAPATRHRPMLSQQALRMGHWEWMSAHKYGREFKHDYAPSPGQYFGKGAYTGMVDDPVGNHTLIQPTLRRVIAPNLGSHLGGVLDRNEPYLERWSPDRTQIWGLIASGNTPGIKGPNLDPNPDVGMGPLPKGIDRGIVQYIHGMSWAMREAVRWGPWCNAYEMGVGHQTTKLASCFACTTYMYAAGFPPTSAHIGRAESWGLLPDGETYGLYATWKGGHEFSDGDEGVLEKAVALSINTRWHAEVYHYLREGCARLKGYVNDTHAAAFGLLEEKMKRQRPPLGGGNLYLDAITWHDSDSNRIDRTIKSAL